MITSAGMNALMIASEALVNPKDEIICVTPVWPNFMRCIEIMGGNVIEIPLIHVEKENIWKLNLEEIKSFLDDLNLKHDRHFFEPCSNSDIIKRMVNNLIYSYEETNQKQRVSELNELLQILKKT